MTKRLPSAKHPRMKPGVPKAKKSARPKGKPFASKPKFKQDEAGSKPPRRAFERSDDRREKPYRAKDKFPPRGERNSERPTFRRDDSAAKPARRPYERSDDRREKPFRAKDKFPRTPDSNDRPPRERKFGDRPAGRDDRKFSGPPRERKFGDRPAGRDDRKYSGPPRERKFGDRPSGRDDRKFSGQPRERKFGERSAGREDRKFSGPPRERKYGERSTPRDSERRPRGKSFEERGPEKRTFARKPKSNPIELRLTEAAGPVSIRIYGRRPVAEILKLGIATRVDLVKSAHGRVIDEIKQLVNEQQLDLRVMSAEEFSPHEDLVEQSVCAYAPPPEVRHDLKAFLRDLDTDQLNTIIMLDGILDPHNFGAILRTAAAAQVKAVIIRDHRQAPLSETAVKASAGMAYFVPIFEVTNLSAALRDLAKVGYWSAATAGTADATSYDEFDWNRNICVILGSEGKGVSQVLRDEADVSVSIPLAEQIDSLNVSVATGILLFEAARQKRLANSEA